jgi:hypothetical protein
MRIQFVALDPLAVQKKLRAQQSPLDVCCTVAPQPTGSKSKDLASHKA